MGCILGLPIVRGFVYSSLLGHISGHFGNSPDLLFGTCLKGSQNGRKSFTKLFAVVYDIVTTLVG
jgi:hypothetical protein